MDPSNKSIRGFSKKTKQEQIEWAVAHFHHDPDKAMITLTQFIHSDKKLQNVLDGFSENTLSNYILPYSVAPNFLINSKMYLVPMVIEESSVVAAASASAKYWLDRGGFQAEVIDTKKVGQIHLTTTAAASQLRKFQKENHHQIVSSCTDLLDNMKKRGGGLLGTEVVSFEEEPNYYQIRMTFETCDSMGANFINSVLERYAAELREKWASSFPKEQGLDVIMCILSNYTPECIVRASVGCPVSDIGPMGKLSAEEFVGRFHKAVRIAHIDPYRATTHNKGIYNGIDAVVLATGNDFRAVESCGHAYAARDGRYRSLSHCTVEDGIFRFWLDIPLALGTVGGLTKLHPLAKLSLELLGYPSARELMEIVASVGLAQNFGALRSLVTTGIQKGHMRMHLSNVLHQLKATETEFRHALEYFKDKVVSHRAVQEFLDAFRSKEASKLRT